MTSPKISIITINYNDCIGLDNTIQSIINQTYGNIEYIVIDGGSTDGSLEVIQKYSNHIYYYISEDDKGIYHAMNKGIKQSSGDYVIFQNSGDWLFNKNVISDFSPNLKGEDIIYGNLIAYYDTNNQELFKGFEGQDISFYNLYADRMPHPSTFYLRNIFEQHGLFDESFKIISDWKFFIKVIAFESVKVKYFDQNICYYDMNGISSINKELLAEERQIVLSQFLPDKILLDYQKMYEFDKLLNTNRFKILKELEKSKTSKKLLSVILRGFLKLFRNKTLSQLK